MSEQIFHRLVIYTTDGKSLVCRRFEGDKAAAFDMLRDFCATISEPAMNGKFFVELADKSSACVMLANVASIRTLEGI